VAVRSAGLGGSPDGATVLVTGGTGSFGSTMVRRLLARDVREVRILSRDELKQHDMRNAIKDPRVRFYLGDVRSRESVDRAMRGVDLVFHAAALKQVPSCEFFPLEAVQTNVIGSHNVIESAHYNDVASVVCLGTDKAAYPINAMGMSKALMEKTAQAFARNNPDSGTTVSTVRYGNVMCSRGSVIPLFVEQARRGKAMTVTDPRMTRFLMSLEEAVMLVEHAFEHARPGDLFIRRAPACTIEVLATAVAELVGVEPKLEIIGTRHGEKLYETLATREELTRAQQEVDYFQVALDARGLNYAEYFDEGQLTERAIDDYHSHNTQRLDLRSVKTLLGGLADFQALVPSSVGP
jgi:UDP-N-acetylglucosamine 4,6-dehydratase